MLRLTVASSCRVCWSWPNSTNSTNCVRTLWGFFTVGCARVRYRSKQCQQDNQEAYRDPNDSTNAELLRNLNISPRSWNLFDQTRNDDDETKKEEVDWQRNGRKIDLREFHSVDSFWLLAFISTHSYLIQHL